MKRFILSVFVGISVLLLFACQNTVKPDTTFYREFDLAATVKKLNVEQLHRRGSGSSGGASIRETTDRENHIQIVYRLDESGEKLFDESSFLAKLKSEISLELKNSGVRTNGGSSGGDTISFNYSTGNNKGSLDLIGARVASGEYKLWCVVREIAWGNERNQ